MKLIYFKKQMVRVYLHLMKNMELYKNDKKVPYYELYFEEPYFD